MDLDQNSARRRERRDGIPCFSIAEPVPIGEPAKVVHLFHPNHPDYEAAAAIYAEREAHRSENLGFFA